MTGMESVAAEVTVPETLLLVAVLLFSALMSRGLARIWVSVPLFLVVVGLALGPSGLGWLDVPITSEVVHAVAAVALSTVLFSDAARTDVGRLRAVATQPVRLLTVGLIGSFVLGTLIAIPLFPGLGVALALVLATILAPTDAALGAPVVSDESVPSDVREVLTVESGLNDGLAVPVLLFALGWAGLQDQGDSGFVSVLVEVLGIGALVGIGAGLLVAIALITTTRRWGNSPAWSSMVPLLTAWGSYLLAEHLGGSGFIAAFVGGLVFGMVCRKRMADSELLVDETVSNLLQGVTWFLFGAAAVGPVLLDTGFDWRWIAYAVLSLTVVRMLPVALALVGTHQPWPTAAFIGWFGPRGLASVVFLIIVLDLSPDEAAMQTIFGTVAVTVFLSILLHGLSARPLATAYGAWASRRSPAATSADENGM
jgi:NhaP-type Na+/H+ or K+/H+ antiporter